MRKKLIAAVSALALTMPTSALMASQDDTTTESDAGVTAAPDAEEANGEVDDVDTDMDNDVDADENDAAMETDAGVTEDPDTEEPNGEVDDVDADEDVDDAPDLPDPEEDTNDVDATETDPADEAEADQEDQTLSALEIYALHGMDVRSSDGEDLGEVEDVVSQNGQYYLVIASGGLLGIGRERTMIEMTGAQFDPEDEVLVINMTQDEFEQQPEYDG
jgi:hypothetical protein